MQERTAFSLPGIPMALVLIAATLGNGYWVFQQIANAPPEGAPLVTAMLILGLLGFLWFGLFMVQPNCAIVLQLFGRYAGSCRDAGLRWTNPFYSKKSLSLRVRNFESGKLKVNDSEGSPIEIAAVVVWQVHDSAESSFNVDNYEDFVHVQSESALRQLATSYPYDLARSRIVEGAVTMVHMALEQLTRSGVVRLDEERKAAMVSNLLVVLCGERGTQPVVNTGTLYT